MIAFLKNHCRTKGYHYFKDHDNIYVTKGSSDLYPCFVAHTDTCASFIPVSDYVIKRNGNQIFGWNSKKNDRTQVGFDDKIGIYIALKMLDLLPFGKAFFPHAEEIGCVGTHKAKMSFFNDCMYAIQCDRREARGITDDILGVEVLSDEFKAILKKPMAKFDRRYVSGGLTDVYTLKTKNLPVVCMNIECGYYSPHWKDDYCQIEDVYATLNFVREIVRVAGHKKYLHTYVPYTYVNKYNSSSGVYTGAYARDFSDDWCDAYTPPVRIRDIDWEKRFLDDEEAKFMDSFHEDKYVFNKFEDYCEACFHDDQRNHIKKIVSYHNMTGMFLCKDCQVAYSKSYIG